MLVSDNLGANNSGTNNLGANKSSANNLGANNHLNIDRGNVLVSPHKDIVVGTHEGNISIASGATAFVMESGHDVVIYDLDQSMPKQISVMVGNHKVVMEPGQMLVLTRQKHQKSLKN